MKQENKERQRTFLVCRFIVAFYSENRSIHTRIAKLRTRLHWKTHKLGNSDVVENHPILQVLIRVANFYIEGNSIILNSLRFVSWLLFNFILNIVQRSIQKFVICEFFIWRRIPSDSVACSASGCNGVCILVKEC